VSIARVRDLPIAAVDQVQAVHPVYNNPPAPREKVRQAEEEEKESQRKPDVLLEPTIKEPLDARRKERVEPHADVVKEVRGAVVFVVLPETEHRPGLKKSGGGRRADGESFDRNLAKSEFYDGIDVLYIVLS
jgi:hypothetical protein